MRLCHPGEHAMNRPVHPMPLSWRLKLSYALPAFALALIGIPIYVYLPKFYTDTIGIDIATVGSLLLAVRIFDAVTDPVIGHVSDGLRTPWGRRRPLIGIGAIGLAVSLIFLLIPPDSPGTEQVLRFGFWLFALFFFWTVITVPYESLGPELTDNYHERTSLFSLRDGMLILGTLVAAASPAMASWALASVSLPVTERARFLIIAYTYAPLILLMAAVCIRSVREKSRHTVSHTASLTQDYLSVLKNKPFAILIAAYTVSAFGSNLPATLILYYVDYVLKADGAEGFLALYFISGILFLPLWVKLSKQMGKKMAWILSMCINTGAFVGVFFLGEGDAVAYGILVTLSGVGFGAGLALPSSIQADVIDYDEMMTGKRREGHYIGFWSIAKKMAAALGVGVGLWLLGLSGYSPNTVQSDDVVTMLRVLYALVPCACNVIAVAIACFYPISEKQHDRIRLQISKQSSTRTNLT